MGSPGASCHRLRHFPCRSTRRMCYSRGSQPSIVQRCFCSQGAGQSGPVTRRHAACTAGAIHGWTRSGQQRRMVHSRVGSWQHVAWNKRRRHLACKGEGSKGGIETLEQCAGAAAGDSCTRGGSWRRFWHCGGCSVAASPSAASHVVSKQMPGQEDGARASNALAGCRATQTLRAGGALRP